jgi:hypothetical protein
MADILRLSAAVLKSVNRLAHGKHSPLHRVFAVGDS